MTVSAPVTPVSPSRRPVALVKGAGDLASGIAVRLHRAGFAVVMTEIDRPTAVRRTVAFAEAVYEGRTEVEGIEAVKAPDAETVRGWNAYLARKGVRLVNPPPGAVSKVWHSL